MKHAGLYNKKWDLDNTESNLLILLGFALYNLYAEDFSQPNMGLKHQTRGSNHLVFVTMLHAR